VPPNPGNLSAFGLLAVDWRTDQMVTKVMREDAVDLSEVASVYRMLERDAVEMLQRDGIATDRIRLVREADVRYAGQSMEVRVQAPAGPINETFLVDLLAGFHAAHDRTFGYHYSGQQKVEVVNFRVSGFGLIERPQIPQLTLEESKPTERRSVRPVYFNGAFHDTAIYDRSSLPAGRHLAGPAVIEEFGSTTVVFPGQTLSIDPHGILIIRSGANA
jgi:N-methylhydantoinase A